MFCKTASHFDLLPQDVPDYDASTSLEQRNNSDLASLLIIRYSLAQDVDCNHFSSVEEGSVEEAVPSAMELI